MSVLDITKDYFNEAYVNHNANGIYNLLNTDNFFSETYWYNVKTGKEMQYKRTSDTSYHVRYLQNYLFTNQEEDRPEATFKKYDDNVTSYTFEQIQQNKQGRVAKVKNETILTTNKEQKIIYILVKVFVEFL